jgi:acetoin utilization deacetylase AcuC-like enzyme
MVLADRFLDHDTGPHHPERVQRLAALRERFGQPDLAEKIIGIEAAPIDLALVERVHDRDYIDRFRQTCASGARCIDSPDCAICPDTYEISRLAAGGMVAAVDAVLDGRVRNAFCALRPPGHHAEQRVAMGFCFFNNIAIAAEHLRADRGIERIAILDFDVHHGNGTQHHFEADGNVLFSSLHQDPRTLFPGTGFDWETGTGAGVGATLNIPMAPGSGDDDYHRAFEEEILPLIDRFKPGFILVSAGFDAHRADPLAQINLSTETFAWMTRETRRLAEAHCQGRLVSALEGGYNLEALADCAQGHVEALAGAASV